MNLQPWMIELAARMKANPLPPDARQIVTATARDGAKQYFTLTGRWVENPLAAGSWPAQEAAMVFASVHVPMGYVRGLEAA